MKIASQCDQVSSVKDGVERPIPTAWREALLEIVGAFVAGDFGLEKGVASVELVPVETALQIRDYLQDYDAMLIALPEATWRSSACVWYGDHWDALIDLWTKEEGSSDLVLHVRVADSNPGFIIRVLMIYVP